MPKALLSLGGTKMKKKLVVMLAAVLCLAFAGCGEKKAEEPQGQKGPEVPEITNMEKVEVYVDGEIVKEAGFDYAELTDKMTEKEVEGTSYYGVPVAELAENADEIKGAFFEAADGFISYGDPSAAMLTACVSDADGKYQPVEQYEGKQYYAGFVEGGMFSTGVNKVYLTTTACDWTVDVQVDGNSVGSLNMADFMKKTPMDGNKVPTAMFDGSFKYKQGAATYEGKFLGFDLAQMKAKCKALEMDIPEEYTNVELTGTNGLGKEGLNAEYTIDPNSEWYIGNVSFFAMYDGKTYCDITKQNVGLTAFINGSGMRWTTFGLSTINFVTK